MTMRITRCVVWFVILATAFVACEKPKKEITTKKEKIKEFKVSLRKIFQIINFEFKD